MDGRFGRAFAAAVYVFSWLSIFAPQRAAALPVIEVGGQPLGANVERLISALEYLGHPLSGQLKSQLESAARDRDSGSLQQLLDPQVLLVVSLNPEVRVKVARGQVAAFLQQGGFTPCLIKVVNESTVTRQLQINSPQSGAVYAGADLGILKRQAQTELNRDENLGRRTDRFLQVEMFRDPPMTPNLSGLQVEYAIALIYCAESGMREATIGFDVGQGTQDLGFRGEVPILFDVRPAIPVKLRVRDHDGSPTLAHLVLRDHLGHVHPPQAKRLAPDFFFQPQVYRGDGETVLLPPGKLTLEYGRGPEYRLRSQELTVSGSGPAEVEIDLERWIDPAAHGYFVGDHHIHGAGCSHYTSPTEGVTPEHMFRQVKGEGLNVGCVLTWGPCFDFQRKFFAPVAHDLSEPFTILKYDLEISGFGSAALGHVCLLNLKDQTFPGSGGTKTEGWPTWTVPVMRWCKEQGGYTGYPHSAMHVNPPAAARRLLGERDADGDGGLDFDEAQAGLLVERFEEMDADGARSLTELELGASIGRAADRLPNLAVPEMNGAGAMEIFVSAAEGVCDFISAMDTARISEWNTWYHLLNCGLPIKLSGETDFPCMSSRRVGQGRVYVHMGSSIAALDYREWCENLAAGRSYVSDGYAHAIDFKVDGIRSGRGDVRLPSAGRVGVVARVAFAPRVPRAVAHGGIIPASGRRMVGDTVNLHAPRSSEFVEGGTRLVEILVNGLAVEQIEVPADGKLHPVEFTIPIEESSWVALREFPQLHTNPVNVIVADKPIRASRQSAQWCIAATELLWRNRKHLIAEHERGDAEGAYQRAIARYRQIAEECE